MRTDCTNLAEVLLVIIFIIALIFYIWSYATQRRTDGTLMVYLCMLFYFLFLINYYVPVPLYFLVTIIIILLCLYLIYTSNNYIFAVIIFIVAYFTLLFCLFPGFEKALPDDIYNPDTYCIKSYLSFSD